MADLEFLDHAMEMTSTDLYNDPSLVSSTPFEDVYNISVVFSDNCTNSTNMTRPPGPTYMKILSHVNVVLYLLICVTGLTGNGLVIYVVLMYSQMKTVTNMYILNLALSDLLFLTMLPITAITVIAGHWLFGLAMCKIYFMLNAVNVYGGAFNLCVMSADRYMAVCHPIRSMKYRTPRIALILCLTVWVLTFLAMLPVILYSNTKANPIGEGRSSCLLHWPNDDIFRRDTAFIWYSFFLGFAIPVSLISVFYVLVILRLRHVGAVRKSKDKRRCHGRVTRLVLTVITVYVMCWLPYWSIQVYMISLSNIVTNTGLILAVHTCTILSYANSMFNPFLYAFLNDNFRQSFSKAFKCFSSLNMPRSMCNEKSVFPCTSQTYTRSPPSAVVEERVELYTMDNSVAVPPAAEQNCTKPLQDEHGFLKPPVLL